MTHPASSSVATHEAAIGVETNPVLTDDYSKPASQDSTAANIRQDAIQSLENFATTGHPLAELLERAKQLIGAGKPEPNATGRGIPAMHEKSHLANIEQETSGRPLDLRAKTTNRLHRSGHFAVTWRRARLQILAALGAAVIGYAFGHVVAGNDHVMRFFLAAAVTMGLFFVFSALATQLNRRRRKRIRCGN